MKQQDYSISDWIDEKVMRGYYTFTIEDVKKNFPQFGDAYVRTSLYRLTIKKKIISPWKGFYVIMPIEFALKAIIPPVFYIDALMSFLNKKYYISLLNAASFYGASHQRAQTFSVITEAPKLRNTAKTGTSILFFSKKNIPEKYIRSHKAQSGYVNVASPELTIPNLYTEIKRNGILYPKVVLAQAILETDWFTSPLCRDRHNLFGLTNPRTGKYYEFDHWSESVRAYYTKVQYKYKCEDGNYLLWLKRIGYAEAPDYVPTVISVLRMLSPISQCEQNKRKKNWTKSI